MINADLITERMISTSIAVRTSSAPQTQKYCPFVSSCFATSCMIENPRSKSSASHNSSDKLHRSTAAFSRRASQPRTGAFSPFLCHLRRHQVHQREDEHPHQVDKVPVQSRHLNVMRVVIFRLQKENHRRHD